MQSQAVEIRAATALQAEAKVGRADEAMMVVPYSAQKAVAAEALAGFIRPRAQLSAQAARAPDAPRKPTRARVSKRILSNECV